MKTANEWLELFIKVNADVEAGDVVPFEADQAEYYANQMFNMMDEVGTVDDYLPVAEEMIRLANTK